MRVRAPVGKVCAIIGRNFVFPFQTIEDILFLVRNTLAFRTITTSPLALQILAAHPLEIFMLLSAYADPTLKQKRPPVSGSGDFSVVVQTLDPAGAMLELEADLRPEALRTGSKAASPR